MGNVDLIAYRDLLAHAVCKVLCNPIVVHKQRHSSLLSWQFKDSSRYQILSRIELYKTVLITKCSMLPKNVQKI